MKFNERLVELRKQMGLSQEELGDRLVTSRQTISKWETGQSYPDFERLVLLSDFYDLSLDELVKGVDVSDVRDKGITAKQLVGIETDIHYFKSLTQNGMKFVVGLGWFMITSFIIVLLLKLIFKW